MADRPDGPVTADETRLRRRSANLATLCAGIAITLPVFILVSQATDGAVSGVVHQGSSAWASGPLWAALVLTVTLVPALMLAAGFLAARRALLAFAAGRWFDAGTVRDVAAFGRWTACAGLAGLVVPTLVSLILAIGAPPGERALVVSIGSGAVVAMLTGGVIWTLGHVWTRATRLRAELDGFV